MRLLWVARLSSGARFRVYEKARFGGFFAPSVRNCLFAQCVIIFSMALQVVRSLVS